ncbi:hypothetical protein PSCLAVI8L_100031 [Pseudoclavibacter sp. 8L]|nr:hypothetical protein PSCLAVI8L_100031 [Pseudoclavibacter sp. 8L]
MRPPGFRGSPLLLWVRWSGPLLRSRGVLLAAGSPGWAVRFHRASILRERGGPCRGRRRGP